MPRLIEKAVRVAAVGTPPKQIDEVIGRVSTDTEALSIAHMRSPAGWSEPGQRPAFDEYTYVLAGLLKVESASGTLEVGAGQAIITHAGEWVRYSTPSAEGAEYVAVCLPAFSPAAVHRDPS